MKRIHTKNEYHQRSLSPELFAAGLSCEDCPLWGRNYSLTSKTTREGGLSFYVVVNLVHTWRRHV